MDRALKVLRLPRERQIVADRQKFTRAGSGNLRGLTEPAFLINWETSDCKGGSIPPLLDNIRKHTYKISESVRRIASQVTNFVLQLISGLFGVVSDLKIVKRFPKRPIRFVKKYSMQISFGVVLALFLTVSVGEGQAYQVGAADFSDISDMTSEGFLGKPQVVGQTVLTGETQVVIPYRVEKGDSLTSIAARYNISTGTLIDYNNIKLNQIEKIKPGDELLIPSEDTDTSLAWLEGLNKLKAEEQEKARQAELKRLQQKRNLSGNLPRIARSVGGVNIVGVYRKLPAYGAVRGQCTQWVKENIPALRGLVMGNGGQYLVNGRKYGFRTGSTAVAGSAVVTNENGRVGHVAYVAAVYSNGTMLVSDMNYVGPFIVSTRVISVNDPVIKGFLYAN